MISKSAKVIQKATKNHRDHMNIDVGPKEGRKTVGEKPGLFLSKAVYCLLCCYAHILPIHHELNT